MRETALSILSTTTVLMMALATVAIAQPPGGRGGRGAGPGMASMPDLVEQLNLNEEQAKAWESIRSEMAKSTEAARSKMRELRDQGVQPDAEESAKIREEMRTAFTRAEGDLLKILDADQKTKYREIKKNAEESRGRGRGGMRGSRGSGGGAGGGGSQF